MEDKQLESIDKPVAKILNVPSFQVIKSKPIPIPMPLYMKKKRRKHVPLSGKKHPHNCECNDHK